MGKKIQAIGFILCLVISTSAFSQIVWQKAAKGMTVSQVKKVVPNAEAFIPTEGKTLGDGAVPLLELKNYEIKGIKFNALFFFKDSRLIQVTLTPISSENHRVAYTLIVETLRSKYGKEVNTRNMSIGQEKSWLTKDKTEITATFYLNEMSLIYSSREKDEMDKI
ncbi:hypothetical protein [Acinetobacter brisouii]